ncbi:hypothetical protein Y1Q_0015261 [Alligator mississippiensis]|uniref:Immunoglobulin V-set domain-containing protein n=1 Tax=Alligator mississippiensis TaxID=8496 RepID=A0A151NL44_ALLMI|nr:hypothetical protein Y1Q_0015261 [Alligator mississippiensis]
MKGLHGVSSMGLKASSPTSKPGHFQNLSVGSDYVEQPPFLMGVSGASPILHCELKEAIYLYMYWYRQQAGRELQVLIYSAGDGSGYNFTAEPMTANRRGNNWTLTWKSLSHLDSAVYYCACSDAQ